MCKNLHTGEFGTLTHIHKGLQEDSYKNKQKATRRTNYCESQNKSKTKINYGS
jgi:hypothetical protein